jgi:SAM-dependent methyltransferase
MWFHDLLVCPDCKSHLSLVGKQLICNTCSIARPMATPLDLSPINPKVQHMSFGPLSVRPDQHLDSLDLSRPPLVYRGPMPGRDSRELLSHLVSLGLPPGSVLDLGCGPKDQEPCFDHLGYKYVGLDLPGTKADVIGDAHFLPFADQRFDVVFSYAVLEHLYNPFLALSEVKRVLKPNGIYIGTVSLGEPFHNSFFHHSPWALFSLCEANNLKIAKLWDGPETLAALSRMGRYPKVIRGMLTIVSQLNETLPFLAPRRISWPEQAKRLDALYRAGSICFAIFRPGTN